MMNSTMRFLTLYTQTWSLRSKQVDLEEWRNCRFNTELHLCGATACAIGWSTSNPVFQMQGFTFDAKTDCPVFCANGEDPTEDNDDDDRTYNWDATEQFFNVSILEAQCIFADTSWVGLHVSNAQDVVEAIRGKKDSEDKLDDRSKVLRRIRRYLKHNGHISKAEAKVLKKSEKLCGPTGN